MVAGSDGRVLGVHIVGEAATELVHVGQLAMLGGATADAFIDHVFNFPTFAEAYRVAALQIARQLLARRQAEVADPLAALAAQRVAELASLVAGGSAGIDTRAH
jgi:NAD(P) transhydrogenase